MEEPISMDSEKSKQDIMKNSQLKKAFGKAKVFEIRRLVRNIKRLAAKKGTTQQLEKNRRRVSRIEKELEALKDLHVDMFVKAASAKTHGDLNSSDVIAEDEEDAALKMKVLDKIIIAVKMENIRDLSNSTKEKSTAIKSSSKKRPKTSDPTSNPLHKTCSNSLKDSEGLDIVREDNQEDKQLDDFFTDPVVNDYNSVDNSKGKAHMKRTLQADDDSDEALDSVFVQNLKGEKGKKKVKTDRKGLSKKQKNRLGQRERRKQWEKLYGNKANHIMMEEKSQETLSKGGFNNSRRNDGMKPRLVTVKHSSLHPSWEASKSKRKQESIVEFKGQKITFED